MEKDNKLQFRNQPQLQEVLDIMRSREHHEEVFHCVPIGKGIVGRYWWAALRTAMKTLISKFRLPLLRSSTSSSPLALRGYGSPCLRSLHMNGVGDVGRKIANLRFHELWFVNAKDVSPTFSVVRRRSDAPAFDADDVLAPSVGESPDSVSTDDFVKRKLMYCCEDMRTLTRADIDPKGSALVPGTVMCAWCTASGTSRWRICVHTQASP